MSFVDLSIYSFLPALVGLMLAIPLFLLVRRLWRNRRLRMLLRSKRLVGRHWEPVFLERYRPDGGG